MNSPAELLAKLPEAERRTELANLTDETKAALLHHWPFWGRPEQQPPAGDWLTWLLLAGRGWGKTRTGAEWVRSEVCGKTPLAPGKARRVAIIAETAADARDVLVSGDSGLLAIHPRDFRPAYEPSKRRLTWPNGAIALLFNATEPDQLRGPQQDLAWCDELAKWRYPQETWDNLMFGLRIGERPRKAVTTTPRPIPIVRQLLRDPATVVTRGSTFDNTSNLAPSFLSDIRAKYEGTRLGRQELNAEVLDDIPGALWTRDNLDRHRVAPGKLPSMQRVVVAIDPAAKSKEPTDTTAETGIIVAGLGVDGRGYIIDDKTCALSPNGWARMAISCFDLYSADAIIAETNQGGEMVKQTLRSVRDTIPVREVHASRGKVVRAEPIAALYEQGRISHAGSLAKLEDQMVMFTAFGIEGKTTADRVDAAVWALTELFPQIVQVDKGPNDWTWNAPATGHWMGA
jgi:predicted phage terminase large subunit-like protein